MSTKTASSTRDQTTKQLAEWIIDSLAPLYREARKLGRKPEEALELAMELFATFLLDKNADIDAAADWLEHLATDLREGRCFNRDWHYA
jgi:hypothetical protein